MTDEATASKDNYIDLRLATISKELFTKSRKINVANQYRPVIQRREEETKQLAENEIFVVGAYVVMNKEQYNKKVKNKLSQTHIQKQKVSHMKQI